MSYLFQTESVSKKSKTSLNLTEKYNKYKNNFSKSVMFPTHIAKGLAESRPLIE